MEIILADFCSQVAIPEASAEAMRYYESGNVLWMIQWAWALIVPLLFLFTGFSGKLSTFAKKRGKYWFFSLCIYLLIFLGIYQLLNLPFDFYAGYTREHEFGLSTQTLDRWFVNYGKGLLVMVLTAIAFVWIFYLLLKKSPRRWWLYSSLVSIGITFLMTFIYPVWIDPFFNQFGSLKDKGLEKSILDLAARSGIHEGRVYEVDKSQDTVTANAYVTGLGDSLRIVIWDTTLRAFNKEEVLFVMGHEMGHYVLRHNWKILGYFSGLFIVTAYLIYRSSVWLMYHFRKRWGFQHLYDIASLPLLLLLLNFFSLVFTPLSNCISRHFEREADRFGLEITQNNEAAAQVFAGLAKNNLANPRPGKLYVFWQGTHPPLAERIEFCNTYCPWRTGEPLTYGAHFTSESGD